MDKKQGVKMTARKSFPKISNKTSSVPVGFRKKDEPIIVIDDSDESSDLDEPVTNLLSRKEILPNVPAEQHKAKEQPSSSHTDTASATVSVIIDDSDEENDPNEPSKPALSTSSSGVHRSNEDLNHSHGNASSSLEACSTGPENQNLLLKKEELEVLKNEVKNFRAQMMKLQSERAPSASAASSQMQNPVTSPKPPQNAQSDSSKGKFSKGQLSAPSIQVKHEISQGKEKKLTGSNSSSGLDLKLMFNRLSELEDLVRDCSLKVTPATKKKDNTHASSGKESLTSKASCCQSKSVNVKPSPAVVKEDPPKYYLAPPTEFEDPDCESVEIISVTEGRRRKSRGTTSFVIKQEPDEQSTDLLKSGTQTTTDSQVANKPSGYPGEQVSIPASTVSEINTRTVDRKNESPVHLKAETGPPAHPEPEPSGGGSKGFSLEDEAIMISDSEDSIFANLSQSVPIKVEDEDDRNKIGGDKLEMMKDTTDEVVMDAEQVNTGDESIELLSEDDNVYSMIVSWGEEDDDYSMKTEEEDFSSSYKGEVVSDKTDSTDDEDVHVPQGSLNHSEVNHENVPVTKAVPVVSEVDRLNLAQDVPSVDPSEKAPSLDQQGDNLPQRKREGENITSDFMFKSKSGGTHECGSNEVRHVVNEETSSTKLKKSVKDNQSKVYRLAPDERIKPSKLMKPCPKFAKEKHILYRSKSKEAKQPSEKMKSFIKSVNDKTHGMHQSDSQEKKKPSERLKKLRVKIKSLKVKPGQRIVIRAKIHKKLKLKNKKQIGVTSHQATSPGDCDSIKSASPAVSQMIESPKPIPQHSSSISSVNISSGMPVKTQVNKNHVVSVRSPSKKRFLKELHEKRKHKKARLTLSPTKLQLKKQISSAKEQLQDRTKVNAPKLAKQRGVTTEQRFKSRAESLLKDLKTVSELPSKCHKIVTKDTLKRKLPEDKTVNDKLSVHTVQDQTTGRTSTEINLPQGDRNSKDHGKLGMKHHQTPKVYHIISNKSTAKHRPNLPKISRTNFRDEHVRFKHLQPERIEPVQHKVKDATSGIKSFQQISQRTSQSEGSSTFKEQKISESKGVSEPVILPTRTVSVQNIRKRDPRIGGKAHSAPTSVINSENVQNSVPRTGEKGLSEPSSITSSNQNVQQPATYIRSMSVPSSIVSDESLRMSKPTIANKAPCGIITSATASQNSHKSNLKTDCKALSVPCGVTSNDNLRMSENKLGSKALIGPASVVRKENRQNSQTTGTGVKTASITTKSTRKALNPVQSLGSGGVVLQTPAVKSYSNTGSPSSNSASADMFAQWDALLTRILSWNAMWLWETELCQGLPPILRGLDAYPHLFAYKAYSHYYNIMKPLLLLEIWESMASQWQDKGKKNSPSLKCSVHRGNKIGSNLMRLPLKAIQDKTDHSKLVREGDLLILHLVTDDVKRKEDFYPVFGFVESVQTSLCEGQELHPGFAVNPVVKEVGAKVIDIQVKVKCRNLRLKDVLIPVQSVTSLTSVHRQFMGLLYLENSILARDIYQPTNNQVFYHQLPNPRKIPKWDCKYNSSQRDAIERITNAMLQPYALPRICLLQGPPGTGKSKTIVGIIMTMVKSKTAEGKTPRILLCAPSNAGVDEVLSRLACKKAVTPEGERTLRVVRLGAPDSVRPDVQRFTLDQLAEHNIKKETKEKLDKRMSSLTIEYMTLLNMLETVVSQINTYTEQGFAKMVRRKQEELGKLKHRMKVLQKCLNANQARNNMDIEIIRKNIMQNADVICCTLNSSGSPTAFKYLAKAGCLTCCIIDEACQSIELDCLIPLQHKLTKLTLVGDPEQLPATVISKKATELSFGQSLFERLSVGFRNNDSSPVMMLTTQYRMHPEICSFPNQHVYLGKLETHLNTINGRQRTPLRPYVVFNLYFSQEMHDCWSAFNRHECNFIDKMLMVLGKELEGRTVGVITPYRGQVAELHKVIHPRYPNVEIETLDGFQGREKDIIIISCVRANSTSRRIGFLSDKRRMNVALTRAKSALYVVGHLDTLECNYDWGCLIMNARERRLVYDVPREEDAIMCRVIKKGCYHNR